MIPAVPVTPAFKTTAFPSKSYPPADPVKLIELKTVPAARSLLGLKVRAPSGKKRLLPAVGATFSSQLVGLLQWVSTPALPVQVRVVSGSTAKAAELAPANPEELEVSV